MASKKEKVGDVVPTVKGFEKDMTCRGFKFAVGETFTDNGPVVRCGAGGFHSCEMPIDVFSHYPPNTSVFASVEAFGRIDRAVNADTKIASASIAIKAQINIPEIVRRTIEWAAKATKPAAGYGAHSTTAGSRAHSTTAGEGAHSTTKGHNSIAAAFGVGNTAQAAEGGWLALAAWAWTGKQYDIVAMRTAKVGGPEGIKPGVKYRLTIAGEFEEVAP